MLPATASSTAILVSSGPTAWRLTPSTEDPTESATVLGCRQHAAARRRSHPRPDRPRPAASSVGSAFVLAGAVVTRPRLGATPDDVRFVGVEGDVGHTVPAVGRERAPERRSARRDAAGHGGPTGSDGLQLMSRRRLPTQPRTTNRAV
nr:hypothetical protein GCM10020241_45640 [Streptoalloteichus tenebrarius]